jgi:hypothetical protein
MGKIAKILILISFLVVSCGRDYSTNREPASVVGGPMIEAAELSAQEQSSAYNICSALRSKRTTFPFKFNNSSFVFQLTEGDCSGNEKSVQVDTVLNLVNASSEVSSSMIYKGTYEGNYHSLVETDAIGVFSDLCKKLLAGYKSDNVSESLGRKVLFSFPIEQQSASEGKAVVYYSTSDGLSVEKIETFFFNMDQGNNHFGLITKRKSEGVCSSSEQRSFFQQTFIRH